MVFVPRSRAHILYFDLTVQKTKECRTGCWSRSCTRRGKTNPINDTTSKLQRRDYSLSSERRQLVLLTGTRCPGTSFLFVEDGSALSEPLVHRLGRDWGNSSKQNLTVFAIFSCVLIQPLDQQLSSRVQCH
jgi:hypothetical protein